MIFNRQPQRVTKRTVDFLNTVFCIDGHGLVMLWEQALNKLKDHFKNDLTLAFWIRFHGQGILFRQQPYHANTSLRKGSYNG